LSWGLGVQDEGFGSLGLREFNPSVQFLPVPFLLKIETGSSLMKVH